MIKSATLRYVDEVTQISYSRKRVHLRELDAHGRVLLKLALEKQGVDWVKLVQTKV